ncbi:uncharacterized protein LOC115740349 isoform X3 [Rhodamnia argentea]|uniref:Uncharacterized protein LOC115740349 isoform X3 n=1 Tax=Rhodamnia argentea TaxID=178133 RepID=A0ABM3HL88_9MYRT|nr:uncharacterized protein LOC115740349 isoform X3 [Rhodamnia argentea]
MLILCPDATGLDINPGTDNLFSADQSLACQPQSSCRMRKLKEQGYEDMHPFVLDLESQRHGVLLHRSAGNRLGLVAFLQETSAPGERQPSHGKSEVRGCELDHNAISCILDSDAGSGSEVARHALWTETSSSYVLKSKAKQVLRQGTNRDTQSCTGCDGEESRCSCERRDPS